MRGPRTAWVLLTRVPWPGEIASLAAGAGWFPVVGALLGGVSGLAFVGAARLGPLTAAAVALAVEVVLTGALHWDGFADCGDALVAGGDRARRLSVMRDPRLGSGGVLALALAALAAAGLLSGVPSTRAIPVLTASGALSRWVVVVAAAWLPAADPEHGTGRQLAQRVRWPALVGASVVAVGVAFAAGAPLAVPTAALAGLGVAGLLARPLGGATGDTYGATAVIAWLAALAAMAWR